MAVIDTSTVSSDLDVIGKYTALVKESLGSDSVYIRAKETVQSLVESGAIDNAQKAEVISGIIAGAVGSITNASMTTALQWANIEKEIALKKLELDQQLNAIAADISVKNAQTDKMASQSRLAQAESRRMYGVATFDTANSITSLSDTGKVWEDMELVVEKVKNTKEENTLIQSRVGESVAAAHKLVADAVTNFGSYSYTVSATGGLSSVSKTSSNVTLSDTQQAIAIELGKGYAYNAWANALTGSASMLGTAIASDYFDFGAGSSGEQLLTTVLTCANQLKSAVTEPVV